MVHLTTDDNVKLYYEEVGSGIPIVFVHEFAGDARAYEMQMRYFGQRYRCIAFNARGYPPSDVPEDATRPSIRCLLLTQSGHWSIGFSAMHTAALSDFTQIAHR
jgi:pimeloyl-ACP methyl ester carboxylesterase